VTDSGSRCPNADVPLIRDLAVTQAQEIPGDDELALMRGKLGKKLDGEHAIEARSLHASLVVIVHRDLMPRPPAPAADHAYANAEQPSVGPLNTLADTRLPCRGQRILQPVFSCLTGAADAYEGA